MTTRNIRALEFKNIENVKTQFENFDLWQMFMLIKNVELVKWREELKKMFT